MKTQLQEMVKNVNELSNAKIQIAGRLDQNEQDHDEANRQFKIEADEQNKLISVLHNELKELQDKLNKQNQKGGLISNKYKELNETQMRVEAE